MIIVDRKWILSCLLLVGCSSQLKEDDLSVPPTAQMEADPIRLVFLTRDGCANTPLLRANLDAVCETSETAVTYELVHQDQLFPPDARVGYPTPTILYDNRDLFGLSEPTPPYPAPS